MLIFLRRIISIVMIIVMSLSTSAYMPQSRFEALKSIEKIDEHVYTMNYAHDYDIDAMLEDGASNTVDLILGVVGDTLFDRSKSFACSTFNAVTANDEYLFARNYDYMDSDCLIVWTNPSNGYASISTVSPMFMGYDKDFTLDKFIDRAFAVMVPYIPLDGMNEKGLSIGVLEIAQDPTFQISNKTALTTTTMIRAVLDKCSTVDEAVQLFDSYNMRDPILLKAAYHYQIADANGDTAVIEYINGKMNVLKPKKRTESFLYQAVTNFVLTPGADNSHGMGYERYDLVLETLDKTNGIITEKSAMEILKNVSMKDTDLHGYICSTLWSVVYNQNSLTAEYCTMNNYTRSLKFSLFQPQVVNE